MSAAPSSTPSSATRAESPPDYGPPRWLVAVQVIGLALLFAVTRLASIPAELNESDEAIFAVCAARLNQTGQLPYVGAFDNKGPLLYWCYQGLFALFGDYDMTPVHAAATAAVAITALLIWSIAGLCFGRRHSAGAFACMFYLIAMSNHYNYQAFLSETPSAVLLALATWLVLRAERPLPRLQCLLIGVLLMLAALSRQNTLIGWPILGFGVAWLSWSHDRRVLAGVERGIMVLVGGLIPLGVVIAIYAHGGHLTDLYWGTLAYNRQFYIAAMEVNPLNLLAAIWGLSHMLDDLAVIMLLAFLGLLAIARRAAPMEDEQSGGNDRLLRCRRRRLLLVLLIGVWFSLTIGWRFFCHYRMIDLPLTCVAATGGLLLLLDSLKDRGVQRAVRIGIGVLLAALCIRSEHVQYLFGLQPQGIYPSQCKEVGQKLHALTTPEDSIFVWGKEPSIYFFARRRMATRFCKTTYQVGLIEGATKMPPARDTSEWVWPESWDLMFTDLAADPPAFVVDASATDAFAWGRYPVSKYPRLAEWLAAHYERFDEVDDLVIYRRRTSAPVTQPVETQPAGDRA